MAVRDFQYAVSRVLAKAQAREKAERTIGYPRDTVKHQPWCECPRCEPTIVEPVCDVLTGVTAAEYERRDAERRADRSDRIGAWATFLAVARIVAVSLAVWAGMIG